MTDKTFRFSTASSPVRPRSQTIRLPAPTPALSLQLSTEPRLLLPQSPARFLPGIFLLALAALAALADMLLDAPLLLPGPAIGLWAGRALVLLTALLGIRSIYENQQLLQLVFYKNHIDLMRGQKILHSASIADIEAIEFESWLSKPHPNFPLFYGYLRLRRGAKSQSLHAFAWDRIELPQVPLLIGELQTLTRVLGWPAPRLTGDFQDFVPLTVPTPPL